jgi:hypothetical protein
MPNFPFPPNDAPYASPDELVKREIKRRRLAEKSAKQKKPSAEPPLDPPPWIPIGFQWDSLPRTLQSALIEFIAPAYDQLVAHVADQIERSTGLSLVGLLWQEIINQFEQGEHFVADSFIRSLGNSPDLLARQLQLTDAKAKITYILLRLREIHQSSPGILPLPSPESRAGILPAPVPIPENCPNATPVDQPLILNP